MGYLLVLLPLVALATGIDGREFDWPIAVGVPTVGEKWGPVFSLAAPFKMEYLGNHRSYHYGENDLIRDEFYFRRGSFPEQGGNVRIPAVKGDK